MKHHVTISGSQPLQAVVEVGIGVRETPYLADHAFQDLVVVPGAYYIELALRLESELSASVPRVVQNVVFSNPVVLGTADTRLRVEVKELHDSIVEYIFLEDGISESRTEGPERQVAARLEIDRKPLSGRSREGAAIDIETLQRRSIAALDAEQFYADLRANGNQYGPHFQRVLAIWMTKEEVLGTISNGRRDVESEPIHLDPRTLDAATQLVAPFVKDQGKTFALQSIERLELHDAVVPDTIWGHATLVSQSQDGVRGNVRVADGSGKPCFELFGVALGTLEAWQEKDRPEAELIVASNFTADPLGDSLRFWSAYFDIPTRVEFAPYNQVFQQLLDPASAFRRNSTGANIILLELEEWIHGGQRRITGLDRERAERAFGGRERYTLPNGLEIVHLNRYETDYVYKEIFEDQCYLRHGIRLRDGATVVDVGANIGLFSLFVMGQCERPRIFAFEPAPAVYELLRANCDAYGSGVTAINAGVSDKAKTAAFTYYENSSVFSGFHSDEAEDRDAIRAVVRNMLNREAVDGASVEQYVDELTADRVRGKAFECRLVPLSEVIREYKIEKIDLLKIDAEKSELDILSGIEESDWPRIEQVVIEIHDPTRSAVQAVEALLVARGFVCSVDQETLLERSGLFNLYARRVGADPEPQGKAIGGDTGAAMHEAEHHSARALMRSVRDLSAAISGFMEHSRTPLLLGIAPRTPQASATAELLPMLDAAESALCASLEAVANVHMLSSRDLLASYKVDDYCDPHTSGHHSGHIPYTTECFVAMGTSLVRNLYNLKRAPFKVIVLDCDNTLWGGVSGEDGPCGVDISEPFRALQDFMVKRMAAGMLLCLCSKNSEQDVLDVLEQRSDMLLKREHLASWRINWNSKSENIKALAKELDLGLDSFIFIDDNPVECAEVRGNCPEVMTLQLPRDVRLIPAFLEHVWAFDRAQQVSTEEDRSRTQMYRQGAERERYREQSFSLKDFIIGLQLNIETFDATEEHVQRISQMTLRTNQFNFTTKRRSEGEIRQFLARDGAICMAVRVTDRFGDYGLVGVLMYESVEDRYVVDTFLLSCRVLGRGVEHEIVARLGRRAVAEGRAHVEFICPPTEKNLPARQFIQTIGAKYEDGSGIRWITAAEYLSTLTYGPDETAPVAFDLAVGEGKPERRARPALSFDGASLSERLQNVGERLFDVSQISKAIEDYRLQLHPQQPAEEVGAGNGLENAIASVWRRVLGRPRIGLHENFFEVGGTSLRAVQVVAFIKKELNRSLPIVTLFDCPTISLLAARLGAPVAGAGDATTGAAAAAAERGQQRRKLIGRR